MNLIEAVIYGIVQGVAEFLPVSSSGHLALAHNFFGVEGEGDIGFVVLLHLATLLSVCIVYHKDLLLIIKGFFTLMKKLFTGKIIIGKKNQALEYGEKLFIMLVIASVPLVPMSLLADRVEYISQYSWVIGMLLIINGGVLYISDKLIKKQEDLKNSDYQKPFFIGLFQVFGVLPGISRSGSTITGGLFFGLNRQDAVKFSFLMSIP
ncbi:MAG: undecaprenyl-diphosphate phosphatase, partial [Firmicutes bacterium HGW-Firmicutes-21]